jgi:2-amino-4-hydroxy-6-hydroxymethyldihydropteridine diphosphokinase
MATYTYILSLGGNIGNVDANFRMALESVKKAGHEVVRCSEIYVSEAWGFASADLFRNMVAEVKSPLPPFEMLTFLQNVEQSLGRTHKTIDGYYESRSIDIDIIFCNDEVISTPRLTIPHPLMHRRNFVLQPMLEFWADWEHPVLHQSIATLARQSDDNSKIWRIHDSMIVDL